MAFLEDPDSYILGMQAQVQIISHGFHDVPTCNSALSRALKVRLGHGMTALVRRKPPRFRFQSLDRVIDLVPVCSEFERSNKASWGFKQEKLVIAGMPRLDDLLLKAQQAPPVRQRRRIVYMPTARDWLVAASDIGSSTYFLGVRDFLLAQGLTAFLHERSFSLELFVHPLLWNHHSYLRDVLGDAITVHPINADLQELLSTAALFITDYSSVAWDALYISVPVLFYQFDADTYFQHRGKGSHIDFLRDSFGPVAKTADTAAALVRQFVDDECHLRGWDEATEGWRQRAFRFHDQHNCKRVLEAINAALARHR